MHREACTCLGVYRSSWIRRREKETRTLYSHNLPLRKASAKRVARLYRKRWTLETALQHLEEYFHSEINTLGYHKAALFGFCLALVAYNMLAVVMAALRSVHGAETIDQELSSIMSPTRSPKRITA